MLKIVENPKEPEFKDFSLVIFFNNFVVMTSRSENRTEAIIGEDEQHLVRRPELNRSEIARLVDFYYQSALDQKFEIGKVESILQEIGFSYDS